MVLIAAPSDSVCQISAHDTQWWCLSVVAKRTYQIRHGKCFVDDRQISLSTEIRKQAGGGSLLEQDLDVVSLKPKTDIIIQGHAYTGGTPKPGIDVTIQVGRHRKDILVIGQRRCTLGSTGGIVISPAKPFERMPMTFAHAYGGRDHVAEANNGNPFSGLAPYLAGTHLNVDNMSPYLYPRNPCGKGFLIVATHDAVEQCELPNIEDPRDLLSPERLPAGSPDRWIYMPMPQGLGWMGWGWFPRTAFIGVVAEYKDLDLPIPEVSRGFLSKEILDQGAAPRSMYVHQFGNGAPIDLQLPFLSGDEEVELTHLHPAMKDWKFRLPGRPKRICTDGRDGKLNETKPVLQTVLIEPDESRVSVVWRGSAPAKRPYFPHELAMMPLLVEW